MSPPPCYVTKNSPVSCTDQATQRLSNCPSATSKPVAEILLNGVLLLGQVYTREQLDINTDKNLEASDEYVLTCQIIQKEVIKLEGVYEALDTVSNCSPEVTVSQFLLGLWGYIPLKNTSEELVTEAMIKICYKLYLLYNIHCGNYIHKLAERIQHPMKKKEEKTANFDGSHNISVEDKWFWKHIEKERLPRSEKYFNSDIFTYGDMTFTNEVLHFSVWYRIALIDLQIKYRQCQSTLQSIISPCQNMSVFSDPGNLERSPNSSKNTNESSKSGSIENNWNQKICFTDIDEKSQKNKKSLQQVKQKKLKSSSQPSPPCDQGTIVPEEYGLDFRAAESTRDSGIEESFSSVDREDVLSFYCSSVTKLENPLPTEGKLPNALPNDDRKRKGEKKLQTKKVRSKTTKSSQINTSLAPDMSFSFPANVIERCI